MGIESVSYRFEPSECEVEDLVEWLREHGATSGDRQGAYVVSEAGYWIDLLVRATGLRVAVVQFRVAVTNPESVVAVLDGLVAELLVRFGGRVTDAAGRRVLDDQDRLDVLVSEFGSGRERFTRDYEDLILPVSADQVFSKLRAASEEVHEE